MSQTPSFKYYTRGTYRNPHEAIKAYLFLKFLMSNIRTINMESTMTVHPIPTPILIHRSVHPNGMCYFGVCHPYQIKLELYGVGRAAQIKLIIRLMSAHIQSCFCCKIKIICTDDIKHGQICFLTKRTHLHQKPGCTSHLRRAVIFSFGEIFNIPFKPGFTKHYYQYIPLCRLR